MPSEVHPLPTGTVLQGRYQAGKLGQGGFGITYMESIIFFIYLEINCTNFQIMLYNKIKGKRKRC